MDFLKTQFLSVSLVWRVVIVGGLLTILLIILFQIGGAVAGRRFNKEIQKLTTEKDEALKFSAQHEDAAQAANIKAAMLEQELQKVSNQLLNLNAQLQDASRQSVVTRKIYVEKKIPGKIEYLTGNASVDSAELCARLRAAGFPCNK